MTFTQSCNQPGIRSVGTKMLLVKVSGKITMKPKICTFSGSLTSTPTSTEIQDAASVNASSSANAASTPSGPLPTRKPRIIPTPSSSAIDQACLTVSAMIRPASGAHRAIGRARSRSKTPLVRSVLSPNPWSWWRRARSAP